MIGESNQNEEFNLNSLLGFDKNQYKIDNLKITKKEIIGLCNNFLNLEDCKYIFNQKKLVNLNEEVIIDIKSYTKIGNETSVTNETIKNKTNKRHIIEFDKKIDELNPLIINKTINETIISKNNLDEELDVDTLIFFKESLNNKNNTEVTDKIEKLMGLIENSNNLSNKNKNSLLKQMKDKFILEQELIISK